MHTSKRSTEHFTPLEPRKLLAVTPISPDVILSTDGTDKFVFYNSNNGSTKSITAPMNEPDFASLSPDRTKILCTGKIGNNDETEEIFICNADGTGIKQLTSNSAQDTEPAFNSDGSKIAFVSDRDGNKEIYVMNADGTGQTHFTNNSSDDTQPQFSPDGTKIVFTVSGSGFDDPRIFTMDAANGANRVQLTTDFSDDPTYSPDGNRIAYSDGGDIWVVGAPGSNAASFGPLQVSNGANMPVTGDEDPVFSPDGTQIAFVRNESEAGSFLFTTSADGPGLNGTQLGKFTGTSLAWASAPTFAGQFLGIIYVDGTSKNDSITVDNALADELRFTLNGKTETFGIDNFNAIEIFAGAGNDTVDGSLSGISFYASGDAGNDSLIGGSNNDTLTGGAGKNTLTGGDGNDRLNGSGGHDYLYGENGNDFLYGNGGDDYLVGGAGSDHMWGGDGDDQLYGNSGNDKMYGEGGDDILVGGAGNDLLSGGPNADTINGQAGTDSVISNDSKDVLSNDEVIS